MEQSESGKCKFVAVSAQLRDRVELFDTFQRPLSENIIDDVFEAEEKCFDSDATVEASTPAPDPGWASGESRRCSKLCRQGSDRSWSTLTGGNLTEIMASFA